MKITAKLTLNIDRNGLARKEFFYFISSKTALNNIFFASLYLDPVPEDFYDERIVLKSYVKSQFKVFLIKLCEKESFLLL